jgi:outer membrane lipoprotein-sorting protein
MRRVASGLLAACCLSGALALGAERLALPDHPSVAQIVERNAAARGGLDAWRKIRTMAWAGHAESTSAPGRKVPFLLEEKRPGMTRFEVMAPNERSVRIFDGKEGWTMRPAPSGRPRLQPYSTEELNFARDSEVIDGPLMAAAAKGYKLEFGGAAMIDGRMAYMVSFRPRPGAIHRVWLDVKTFLEVEDERSFTTASGRRVRVALEYRDYHDFKGLKIPVVIESKGARGSNKLVIDKVALNPRLKDGLFARPRAPDSHRRGVIVDTRRPPVGGSAFAPAH